MLHILTIKGEFYQQLDLRRFPFDVQALTVGIQAREGSDKVIFTSGGSPRFGFGSCALAEWSRCDAEEAPMLKACMEIENHLPNEEEMEENEQVQRFLRSQGMYHYAIDGSAGRRTGHPWSTHLPQALCTPRTRCSARSQMQDAPPQPICSRRTTSGSGHATTLPSVSLHRTAPPLPTAFSALARAEAACVAVGAAVGVRRWTIVLE